MTHSTHVYHPELFEKKRKQRKNKICALTFRIKESNFDIFDNKCIKKKVCFKRNQHRTPD